MNVQEYLRDKLRSIGQVQPTPEDVVAFGQKGLEQYLFDKVTSKKFRKWSIDEDTKKRVREAIAINIEKKQPLQFTLPFGGYKIWRLPSAPEVDWAEFFSICHYATYLGQITAVYEPGATMYFSSDDVIVEQMDNFPKKDTEAYAASFQALLDFFRPYFPKNLSMKFVRVADMYPDKSEYERELAEKVAETKEIYKTLDPVRIARKRKTSVFNVRWDGARDLTSLSEKEKQAMIELGPILHDGYCALSKRKAFVRGEDKIVIFPSAPINNGIAIGSTKNSIVKFWTGFGIVQTREDLPAHQSRINGTDAGFRAPKAAVCEATGVNPWSASLQDRILSPEQLNKVKNEPHETVRIDLVPLKNFQEITVFNKTLEFSA